MKKLLLLLCACVAFLDPRAQDIHVFFAVNSDQLRSADLAKLDQLINTRQQGARFLLQGYADSTGASRYNLGLSQRRAIQVKNYLVSKKIPANDISIQFYGERLTRGEESHYSRRVGIFVTIPQTALTYEQLIETISPREQVFRITTSNNSQIEGKKGTLLNIPANAFRDSAGRPVTGEIEIGLTEYYSMAELISQKLSTVAAGNLLVSGGVINLKARQGGKELLLQESKEITVSFPKSTKEEYYTFYGQRQPDGNMDWDPDERVFQPKPIGATLAEDGSLILIDSMAAAKRNDSGLVFDSKTKKIRTVTEEEKKEAQEKDSLNTLARNNPGDYVFDASTQKMRPLTEQEKKERRVMDSLYSHLPSKKMNWINCDYFMYDRSSVKLRYQVEVDNEGVAISTVFLVFSNFNSLLALSRDGDHYSIYARLPADQPVKLMVCGMAGDTFYMYFEEVKLRKGTDKIILKKSSVGEYKKLLYSL